MHLFLCEKPDQAGKLAKVLGGARLAAGKTHWETNGGWVTWALGHLLETCKPDKLDTRWGSPWRLEQLPMLPPKMQYVPAADKQERLKAIGSLLERCDEVFVATDGGTEGEMIGREILDLYRFTGPVNRVWLSALTPVAIQKALDNTLPGDKTIGYYHSALGRSHADWLIGMNGTRVLSCRTPAGSGTISLGRVQTPTVAIVVWRDREIANFKARDYYEVVATVRIAGAAKTVALRHAPKPNIFDRGVADHLAAVARGATQPLTVVSEKGKQSQPPAPFELNTLTKTASRLWRWSAKKTLSVAQSLYETHTAITYPRTDCKYLTDDARSEVPVLTRLLLALPEFAWLKAETFAPGPWFNTAKVDGHDHDAIRPTEVVPEAAKLSADESKLYLLIATQYLASLLPAFVYDAVEISMSVDGRKFSARGTTPVSIGWKIAFSRSVDEHEQEETDGTPPDQEAALLPAITDGQTGHVDSVKVENKATRAPKRYTEGTLLAAMIEASRFVTDPKLQRILNSEDGKQRGIGTVATRPAVLEDIKECGYIEVSRNGELSATPKGHGLVRILEQHWPAWVSPAETALLQIELERIQEGVLSLADFTAATGRKVAEAIAVLGRCDEKTLRTSLGITEKGTGVCIPSFTPGGTEPELIDRGDHWTAEGWPGRFFKSVGGVDLGAKGLPDIIKAGRSGLHIEVPSKFKGLPPVKVHISFDASATPYPRFDVKWPVRAGATTSGAPTGVTASWGHIEGEVLDWGVYYTMPGVEAGGRDVRFTKVLAGHSLTPNQLAAILTAGRQGHRMDRTLFRNGAGQPFGADPIIFYNPRRRPIPGLEFTFG